MELLHGWLLDILATALVVSAAIAALGTLGARCAARPQRIPAVPLIISLFALCLLGFVTGETMAQSRESAVGAVIPAVLTLLGGLGVFVMGSRGVEERAGVSAAIAGFALAVLVGSMFGTQLRLKFEDDEADPMRDRVKQLAAAQDQLVLESKRLQYYVYFLRTKRQLAEENKVDLSHFYSSYERKADDAERHAPVPAK
jgi:hypothetical protein